MVYQGPVGVYLVLALRAPGNLVLVYHLPWFSKNQEVSDHKNHEHDNKSPTSGIIYHVLIYHRIKR